MESTGIYWVALYEVLEAAGFEVKLVNAREVKNLPGRKSDVLDCQWIQQLPQSVDKPGLTLTGWHKRANSGGVVSKNRPIVALGWISSGKVCGECPSDNAEL